MRTTAARIRQAGQLFIVGSFESIILRGAFDPRPGAGACPPRARGTDAISGYRLDWITLSLVFGAVGLATVAQLVSGFGLNLLLVPLLLIRVLPVEAVALGNLFGAIVTTVLCWRERRHVDPRGALGLLGGGLAGIPIGLAVVTLLSPRASSLLIVVVVLLSLWVVLRGLMLPRAQVVVVAAGVIAGALVVSTGMNGPPMVAALRAAGYDERRYRATLAVALAVQSWAGFAALSLSGAVHRDTLPLVAAGLLAMPAAFVLGERLFSTIDGRKLRRWIIALLLVSLATVLARL